MHRITISLPEDLAATVVDEAERMAELVEQYGDFPLEGTDANVVALAERLGTDLVISLHRRHMCAARLKDGRSLRVIPE